MKFLQIYLSIIHKPIPWKYWSEITEYYKIIYVVNMNYIWQNI
jgi:hypothetical protein